MNFPSLNDLKIIEEDRTIITEIEDKVLESGYELLKTVSEKYEKEGIILQIATTESLTAGLIMSSLVKLPIAGWLKYGCFGVYDTDAKRVFNSVTVDDVYTHTCAKQMAIGMLKNSTATFAIAVTGNAMPYFDDLNKLGEVFIGIASYNDDEIIYATESINGCLDDGDDTFEKIEKKCKSWLQSQPDKNTFAKRSDTATISLLIRNYTAYAAMKMAVDFINTNKLKTPLFIQTRKDKNAEKEGCIHNNIPSPKYPDDIIERCVSNNNCVASNNNMCDRINVKEIPEDWRNYKAESIGGKSRKTKKKVKKNIRKTKGLRK